MQINQQKVSPCSQWELSTKHDTKSWSDNLSSPSAVTRVSDCVWSRPMAESAVQSAMGMMQVEMETGFSGFSKGFIIEGLGIHGGR